MPSAHTRSWPRSAFGLAALALWLTGVAAGFDRMLTYEGTPGARAAAPRTWPADTLLAREPDGPTLLVFLHPYCPCSRATLAELERLVAQGRPGLHPRLVFLADAALGAQQECAELRLRAARLAGASVTSDPDGRLAAAFGARTSGECLIYSSDGALRFRGGLTAGRGHAGENEAWDAAAAVLDGARGELAEFPVFGCALLDAPRAPAPALPLGA